MNQPKNCTIQELADFFVKCRAEVIHEWVRQTETLLHELHLDAPTITNHVPDVVDEIARDLTFLQDGVLRPDYTRGATPAHGIQRFHDGLDVGEVVAEYNLLRTACNTVAERHGLYIAGEVARIVNHRVDEAVKMSVLAFAAYQSVARQKQEAEHLSFIAHDLRTPLHAVSLVADVMRRSLAPEAQANAGPLFEAMRRNLRHVEELIQKVLETKGDVSPSGTTFSPERRPFPLAPLVDRLLLDLQAISAARQVVVENQIAPALTIFGDEALLGQVFQNLLGNAFEYAPNGRVVMTARANGDSVTCTVQDDGAGIPAAMLGRVFKKLVTDPAKSGTGLGLAIVKQIVEAHGGTVSVESTEGAGAAFSFTLPAQEKN